MDDDNNNKNGEEDEEDMEPSAESEEKGKAHMVTHAMVNLGGRIRND